MLRISTFKLISVPLSNNRSFIKGFIHWDINKKNVGLPNLSGWCLSFLSGNNTVTDVANPLVNA